MLKDTRMGEAKMRIKEISIHNFRQYQNIKLTFPEATDYDLNYILAENGIGKTTLLNAITWCFYGKEMHITKGLEDRRLPLLTLATLKDMECGDEVDTVVTIVIEEETGGEVSFERFEQFRKTEEGEAYSKKTGQKVILAPQNGELDVLKMPDEFEKEVNRRLPLKIQNFFFFDGEQLDTYLSSVTGQNVEDAVLQISQIDLLVTMEKNLRKISDEFLKEASKSNSKSKKLNKELEEKRKEEELLKEEYENRSSLLEKAQFDLNEINNELGDCPDVAELEREREELDNRLENRLTVEKENNLKEYKKFIKKYLILLSALPRLRGMYDFILEKENNNQLPPKYDKNELESMIKNHHCNVCDRELDNDSIKYILSLIDRYEMGHETGVLLTSIQGLIEILIKEAKQYKQCSESLLERKNMISDETKKVNIRIKELDGMIDRYTDKERIKNLYKKREELEKYINDEVKVVARKEIELENCSDEVVELKDQLEAALSKDEKIIKLRQKAKFSENAKDKVKNIITIIKSDIREKISKEMSDKFFEFMWKENFSKVELTENYTTSVKNKDGL